MNLKSKILNRNFKVALVADWITNPGGDDKVLWALHELFPKAPIFTTIYNPKKMPRYNGIDIRTTYLNSLPLAKTNHQRLIPLMFNALKRFDFSDFDIIISSSHTVGKSIRKPEGSIHICYCHTPLRYVWAPKIDSLDARVKLGALSKPLLNYLKKKDIESAQSVDYFIANSFTIAKRILRAYGKPALTIYPPVDTLKFKPAKPVTKKDFYLSAGRLIPYKKIDLIIRACKKVNKHLVIAGTGPELENLKKIANDDIEILGFIDDKKLVNLYREAKAFIFAAYEDFGIVPVEAMAAGTPVIAYRKGGATETVIDNKTGVLFKDQSVVSIIKAIKRITRIKIKPSDCIAQAKKFDSNLFKEKITKLIDKLKQEL